jgi:predicted transcriptional regulator
MVASEIKSMEDGLAACGRSVSELCAEAGINQSTWTRWKAGKNVPNLATWGKVRQAFDAVTATDTGAAA